MAHGMIDMIVQRQDLKGVLAHTIGYFQNYIMANIRIKNLCKRYRGGFDAVKNVNLEIGDKEFIVLVGPSGCGKSTTLRMMAGLEEVTSGEIWINDRLVNDVPAKDRNIAMVFQNYALYPHMSVFENMAFGLKLHHYPKPEVEKRVHEAAEDFGDQPILRTPAARAFRRGTPARGLGPRHCAQTFGVSFR